VQARLRSLEQLMPFATEGELRAQIDAGAWNVLEPDAALVMEQPDGLWDRLVRYCERLRNTI
jgi:hypothetical protein